MSALDRFLGSNSGHGTAVREMIPLLREQLAQTKLEGTEGRTTLTGLGEVQYTMGELQISSADIPPDQVRLQVQDGGLHLTAAGIELTVSNFDWHYDKLSFPRFSSGGKIGCAVREVALDVRLRIGAAGVEVGDVVCEIHELDLTVSDTRLRLVYQALLALFKADIKRRMEAAVVDLVRDAVQEHARNLL